MFCPLCCRVKSYGGALTGFLCLSLATLPRALLLLVKSTCGQAHSLGSRILYHETGENKERAVSRSRGQEPYLASKRGERGDVQVVVAPRVVPLCAAALSATVRLLSPRSKVLGWRWISMEMKMTPGSARIMHVTSEYF